MQNEEFLKKVQDRIGPTQGSAATDEASLAISATLKTLGECIPGEEARKPRRAATQADKGTTPADKRGGQGLLTRNLPAARQREGSNVDAGTATDHASAVMSVLGEAASGGELEAIRAQLPQEFDALVR